MNFQLLPLLLLSAVKGALLAAAIPDLDQRAQPASIAPVWPRVNPLTSTKALEHLKATCQYESLGAAITAARYEVRTNAASGHATAANPANGLVCTFAPEGLRLRIHSHGTEDALVFTSDWRLYSFGYGAAQIPVPAGELQTEGSNVELVRPGQHLTEWFHNKPGGLEHGFTIAERPATNPQQEPLRLVMTVSGDLTPYADVTGKRLELHDAAGRTVLFYEKLRVWDATGAELTVTMTTTDDEVRLVMNDTTACYPLSIDPTFTQQAYLKASNTGEGDIFGDSVAVSGDTVVVGAAGESSNATGVNGDGSNDGANGAGAAYVFVRSGGVWTQQAYLKASNTGQNDEFGWSVAVSGDTVVVGAHNENSNAAGVNGDGSNDGANGAGAAYVFVRSGGVWTQQAYLKASNTGEHDRFGSSVAVSGDTVVVGAQYEASNATGVNGDGSNDGAFLSGAAYVFVRSGGVWTQQAYLKASNTGERDLFGWSVAVSGDTVVVGAVQEASNATGVDGDGSNDDAFLSGAAYVFVRSGGVWTQQAYLKASNTSGGYTFGNFVAVSGDTVVVGSEYEDSNHSARGSGAAYVFMRNGGTWSQQAYLKASNTGEGDHFGRSVAVLGDTVVVGAPNEASNATGVNGDGRNDDANVAGAAYVFVRSGGAWTQQAYLKASNTGEGDEFGWSVAVSGDTVVVGAASEASNATGVNGDGSNNSASKSGAVYAFQLVTTIKGQLDMVGELEAPGTVVRAYDGPWGAQASFGLPAPYYGSFTLDTLPPSTIEDPPHGYKVGASLNFRPGHRHEFFNTPVLGEGSNPAVILPGDINRNIGFQFVMFPGFVEGGLHLQGPTESLLGHPSALRGIVRLNEPGADYSVLPDNLDSRVSLQGKDEFPRTATKTAAGGLAQASFEGDYNPATSAFDGNYQLVLAGLNGNRSTWEHLTTRLLLRGGSPDAPESYVNHTLLIQEMINPQYRESIEVGLDHQTVDLNYCFGEVVLEVESTVGTLWNPTLQVVGEFATTDAGDNLDFQGNVRSFRAEVRNVVGTPTASGVSSRGRLVVMLPQGEYPIVVSALVEDPPGVITPTTYSFGPVKVGCGEHLSLSSGLQVQVTSAPACSGSGSVSIGGTVATPPGTFVSQIFWRGNDNVNHLICEDCGANPAFSFLLPANGPCADTTFTVTASTAAGLSASVTRTLRDTIPPDITVGPDKTVDCGTVWDFDPATATDACSGAVPVEIISTLTNVLTPGFCTVDRTWRATDACGNSRERTQRVTVRDTQAPTLECHDITLSCPQPVFYTPVATDNCGTPTLTYNPPDGSYFGFGVTPVFCTAVDSCGLRSECRFNVTVEGNCSQSLYGGAASMIQGAAQAEARADGSLRLHNLGNSGLDGLRLDFGAAEGIRLDFDDSLQAKPLPAGAVFAVTALPAGGALGASLRLERSQSYPLLETIPDLSGLGSTTYGLRLYKGADLIYESRGRTPIPANQSPLKNQVLLTAQPSTIRVAIKPDRNLVFESAFDAGTGVTVVNDGIASDFLPDRMEIDMGPAGVVGVPLKLSGLELRFSGISERIITGMALTKFGQEIRASQGVLVSGDGDKLALRTQPSPPAVPLPKPPALPSPLGWNLTNPLGYFGDSAPGNPSGYSGYWEGENPLGNGGKWDLLVDLTEKASTPLNVQRFRPGKSDAELKLSIPTLAEGAVLRFVAGGVENVLPGALTVERGSLLLEGKAGRHELRAHIPGSSSLSPEARQRLEVTLVDGGVRTFDGNPEELRIGWDPGPVAMEQFLLASIQADGRLLMGTRFIQPGPIMVHLPNGDVAQATSLTWAQGPELDPASIPAPPPGTLRGVLLVGKDVPALSIEGLTISTVNPTKPSNFAGHLVRALGYPSFRQDAFGSLLLSGLSQSGNDGVAIEYQWGASTGGDPPVVMVSLGSLPVSAGQLFPVGSRLDFQLLDEDAGGGAPPNAVLAGQTISDHGPYLFGVRFPEQPTTRNTLRLFLAGQLRFEQKGRPSEADGVRGNLAPGVPPDQVAAQFVNGQFMWVMSWNRSINVEVYNQFTVANPILADRVEIVTEDVLNPASRDGILLELRASHIDTLRLLNPGNRSAVLPLTFGFDAGRLTVDWARSAGGMPRVQVAPHVDGPWSFSVGKILPGGESRFETEATGSEGYTRLVALKPTEGCLNFTAETPGDRPNAWVLAGWKFDRFRPDDSHSSLNEIIDFGGSHALWFDGHMDIETPAPAGEVDIGFIHFGPPVKFEAFDDEGLAEEVFVTTPPITDHAQVVTLHAREGHPLVRLRITGAAKAVHLRELCLRAFQFTDPQKSRACLPLRTVALGDVPNPWIQGDLTITALDATGPLANGRISPYGGFLPGYEIVGYEVNYQIEIAFAHPCPQVEIEFISGSGLIDFQAYDDLDTALPLYHLNRVTAAGGETAVFTGSPRPIKRIVITSPNDKTRLLNICCGPVPVPFCREVNDMAVRPTRNPQPLGDTIWTFYDASGGPAASALRTEGGETGLELTRETVIDSATDQLAVELQLVVVAGGATLSAEATTTGGRTVASLPEAIYEAGVHTLTLTDYCPTGCGEHIRRVRLKLPRGNAIVTRVCTPRRTEN